MKLDPSSPMRSALMSVLIFEIVVFWLAFAGVMQLGKSSTTAVALSCAGATAIAILGIAGLRRGWGYYFGWATQLAAVALGVYSPWLLAMGLIFALVWVMSFVLGKRIDIARKAAQ